MLRPNVCVIRDGRTARLHEIRQSRRLGQAFIESVRQFTNHSDHGCVARIRFKLINMDNKFSGFHRLLNRQVNCRQYIDHPKRICVISLPIWRTSRISLRIVVPNPISYFKLGRTGSQIVTVFISFGTPSQVVACQSVCFPLGKANRLHELVRAGILDIPGPLKTRSIGALSSLPNMRKLVEYPVASWMVAR